MGRIKKGEDWPELTEENFKIGEENGINRKNVRQRYVNYGWTIERATSEPIETSASEWSKWKDIAKQNGIYNELFNIRVKKGLTPEQAATKPVEPRGGAKHNGFWETHREQAEALGIKKNTFYKRIYKGKTPEQAATKPVGSRFGKR